MPSIHRIGDPNSAGGTVTVTPQGSVFANGRLVAVNGSIGTSHPPCPDPQSHCSGNWLTSNGSPNVFAGAIPVNRTGDSDTCGHPRALGSPDVFVN